jgi:hypothetical protein
MKLEPWTFIWFLQANIPTHAKIIYKWSFRDVFQTPLDVLSPKRFRKWIPTIISTLLSYHTRSHSMLNCTYSWGSPPFNHDQAFRWNSSHCHRGNVVLNHKPCFMLLVLQHLCSKFLPTPIWSSNRG